MSMHPIIVAGMHAPQRVRERLALTKMVSMADRDELARDIYALGKFQSNMKDGKPLGYFRDLEFEELGARQASFYALADWILAAGYRKVAQPVTIDAPLIEGPWDV